MRAMGGLLLLLLIGVGVYLFMSAENATAVNKVRKEIEPEVRQIAGRDSRTGGNAADEVTFDLVAKGNSTGAVKVVTITAGSDIEKFYGLIPGDVITQLGQMPVEGIVFGDDDAKAYFLQAYQSKGDLAVTRNGQQIKLPRDRKLALTAPVVQSISPTNVPVVPTHSVAPSTTAPAALTPPPNKNNTNARSQANRIAEQLGGRSNGEEPKD